MYKLCKAPITKPSPGTLAYRNLEFKILKIHTVSREGPVSEGQELENLGGIDQRPDRRIRSRRQCDDDLSRERPIGADDTLAALRDIDVLEEELSVDLDVEDSPTVRAGAAAVLKVERDVVESVT